MSRCWRQTPRGARCGHDDLERPPPHASGDSLDGGPTPIRDGDLVLCEWLTHTAADEVAGKACLLAGYEGDTSSFAVLKVPVKRDGTWWLHSWNDQLQDQPVPAGVELRAVAPASQRYADRFLSPSEFQWESQASTTPESKRGRNIIEQHKRKQTIHLFCRYTDDQPFIYCGTLQYVRQQGSEPVRVWFKLDHPLPERLWQLWRT